MIQQVLLVEDQPLVGAGLESVVNSAPDLRVCGLAEDQQSALALLRSAEVHLAAIVLAPGRLELVAELHRLYPALALVVVSNHDEPLLAERAMRAGASACVSKRAPTSVVLDALRRALGQTAGAVTEQLREAPTADSIEIPRLDTLSDRELEVFQLIGGGFSTTRIAEKLSLSPKTIHTYRSRLREKLRIDSSDRVLYTAVRWVQSKSGTLPDPRKRQAPREAAEDLIHCFVSPFLDMRVELEPGSRYVLGRGIEADVQICSAFLSRAHATVNWEGGAFLLTDLGSTNGTYLNGHPATSPCWLRDRDRLNFGHVEVWYLAQAPESAAGTEDETRPMDRGVKP